MIKKLIEYLSLAKPSSKNRVTYSRDQPKQKLFGRNKVRHREGDIWIDVSSGYKMYVWQDGQWEPAKVNYV